MAQNLQYKAEVLSESLMAELVPLLLAHWEETTVNIDIPLNPDLALYLRLQEAGTLRLYTVREEHTTRLVGYAAYIVNKDIDHATSLVATCSNIFIKKSHRGSGFFFIKWCDEHLQQEKVNVIYRSVKAKHNFGRMLERLGYQLVDLVYSRRVVYGN